MKTRKRPPKAATIQVRQVEKEDLEDIVEAHLASLGVKKHPDFGGDVDVAPSWAITSEEIRSIIRQTKDFAKGAYETRTNVCELTLDDGDGQGPYSVFCGAFAYQETEVGYDVFYVITNPDANPPATLATVVGYLKGKADKSPKRKTVTYHLRDRDEEGISTVIPFFKKSGFAVTLVPDYFESERHDAWRLTYVSTADNFDV